MIIILQVEIFQPILQVNCFQEKFRDKGGLISEGILTLVPLPKISAKSHPWAERLNFLAFSANNLGIQIFCSGARFGTFFGNGVKAEIPSEIKLPLYK